MNFGNHSCNDEDVRTYQHQVYAVVYSVILAPGLLCNVLALWVFRVYVKETKKAVVFMMNLAMADLLQVKTLLCLFSSVFGGFIKFSEALTNKSAKVRGQTKLCKNQKFTSLQMLMRHHSIPSAKKLN